ncbi:MAG TPA: RyR domain-containing protein [Candidatus Binatia bacterium]|nr:RyR domain-containing protein [Candidatus Binatia bacterium]
MSFEHVGDVESLLRSDRVSVRDLHAIWAQRQPVPDPDQRKKADGVGRPAPQIAWLQQDIALARLFTRHALAQEEFLLVWDAAREILRLDPADQNDPTELVRVRMDYASALTRLGLTRDARSVIEPCLDPRSRPVLGRRMQFAILLQLGDILREESQHVAAKATYVRTAEQALGFYQRALALDPTQLDALVLTAAAAFVLGEEGSALRDEARSKARDVVTRVNAREDDEGPSLDTTWARATALTVLGDVQAATRHYELLQTIENVTTAQLAERRYWAQFLAEALGQPRDLFKSAFPPLQLIVFAGHLPDRPGERVRFPPESIEGARESLRKQLDTLQARVGLVSACAGADLLFAEALLARGGTVHLVLPWSKEEFRRTSIEPFDLPGPPVWQPLFERAIDGAATIREIGQVYEPSSDVGWEYMVEVSAGIALYTARASRLDIQPMVFWNGFPGRGAGGTDSTYWFWHGQLQEQPIIVQPPAVPVDHDSVGTHEPWVRRCERSSMHQEVKSMLFADIVGYSKLTEKVVPEFVGAFLGRVAQLIATSKHAPCSVNTWGDAIYAVFDFARDAGLFALELAQLVQEGRDEWLALGLYWELDGEKHPLNIRTGLHAGPVVMHYDPVVRRLGFTGSHVNRAARIEPVTRPGEVFASEEFAALAELGAEIERRRQSAGIGHDTAGDEGFVCEYGGTIPLAKGYPGRYRIYRVVPQRVLALEDLARAQHDSYCAESRMRGDTPLTNRSMRPWEDLTEDLRHANRANVADIPDKLRLLGYELAPSHGMRPSEIIITDADIEMLAMREHDRWMAERRRSGWTFAPKRDDARKHHPLLIPWDLLTEPDKVRDRNTIRDLPLLVERAGFRVRKIV